jgi:integrase
MDRFGQEFRANMGKADSSADTTIEAINARLDGACIPLKVRRRGNALYIRGTFPSKTKRGKRQQYDLALRQPASKDGLKRAEREAYLMAQALADGSFKWSNYIEAKAGPKEKPIAKLTKDFKASYLRSHNIKEETWETTWAATFRKLPQEEPLRDGLLLAVVLASKPNSRNREQTCQRLQGLADFAGISIDLRQYMGDYQPVERDIPSDELIVEWRDRILNPAWQWAYGVIATFGIRPHEVFSCQLVDPLTLKIGPDTKTGRRTTRAIMPEWSEQWGLIDVKLPQTKTASAQARGALASRQFSRYGVPFVPYDLRHAWAVRASVRYRLPLSTAASMMGHSVQTHTKVYHRWLKDAENEQVYNSMILGR